VLLASAIKLYVFPRESTIVILSPSAPEENEDPEAVRPAEPAESRIVIDVFPAAPAIL
jgi:hypothetical protein